MPRDIVRYKNVLVDAPKHPHANRMYGARVRGVKFTRGAVVIEWSIYKPRVRRIKKGK